MKLMSLNIVFVLIIEKGSLFVGYTSVDDERQQGDGFIGNISDGWVKLIDVSKSF